MQKAREVVVYPPKSEHIAKLACVADIQFLEPFSSEAINRKFLGVMPAAIYRGFKVSITGDAAISVGDSTGLNTAIVERNGVAITVQGQHSVELSIPYDTHVAVVIDAIYEHGLITKQVDSSSAINAAEIRVVPVESRQAHHLTVCEITLPSGEVLDESMIDYSNRPEGGALDKYTRAEVDKILSDYFTRDEIHQILSNYITKSDLITNNSPHPISDYGDVIELSRLNIVLKAQTLQLPNLEGDGEFVIRVDNSVDFSEDVKLIPPEGEKIIVYEQDGSKFDFVRIVQPNTEYRFIRINGEWQV